MAIALRDYAQAFFRSRDIEELIPFDAFVTEQTCLTKVESAIACFSVHSVDDECRSAAEIQSTVHQLIAANNLFEPHYRHYQYLFRARRFDVPERGTTHSRAVRELESRRRNHLLSKKAASIEIYQAIEALPDKTAKLLSRQSALERRRGTRQRVNDLDLIARAYQVAVPDLELRRLGTHDSFSLFWRLLHTGETWQDAPPLRADVGLSRQLRRASVSWDAQHDCLRVGRNFVRIFTLQELPDESEANLFGELLKIDSDLTLVTTWQPQERVATREQLVQLRTLMINLERQGLSTKRAMRNDPGLREALEDAGVRDDLKEISQLLGQIRRKRHVGTYSLTILLHAPKIEELEKPVAEIGKIFRLSQAQLHEETGQFAFGCALPTFFGILPGNSHLNTLRTAPLRNDHYAELSTVWSCDTGERSDEYANLYETRLGPLHKTAHRYAMVANDVVLGMTRSGKTAYQIDRLGALQVERPITRIYDVGSSYEPLCHYFDGAILRCSLGDWDTPVNPFDGPAEDDNFREFCFEFVRFLIESDGYRMTYEDSLQLHRKLTGLFKLPRHLRRLQVLQANLEGEMKHPLRRWIEGGQYGKLFDHSEDELQLKDFQVFEFQKSQDGMPHPYLKALHLLLIYRDTQILTDPRQRARMKVITFDECLAHFSDPQTATYIQKLLQTMQKYNVVLSLLMQSPENLGALKPFVLQNCSSFAFFPNPKIADAVLREFGLDDKKIEVFRSLQPREFLFHGAPDLWKVLKLTLDPYRYWMSTTSPLDVVKRNEVFEQYGPLEGLNQLAAAGGAA